MKITYFNVLSIFNISFINSKLTRWLIRFIFVFFIDITAIYAFSAYSNAELEQLEKEFIHIINKSNSIERNPLASQYINYLGNKLAQFADIYPPYFFIVKSNEINAFAGPGGYIGVNTQLILMTENESELAAVMAHELAHVRLHHLYNLIQHQKEMRIPMLASLLASIALGVINPTLGSGALLATLGGFAQDNINYTRANEKEADRIGIDMLIKAGFNPHAMASFFKKMQEHSRYYYTTTNIPEILRSHPLDEDRIAEAENRSMRSINKKNFSSLDYILFKELLRVYSIQNKQKVLDYYTDLIHKNNCFAGCQYGYALTLLQIHQYQNAENRLHFLIQQQEANIFYQIALAQAEIGNKKILMALNRLQNLHDNYPENYAVLITYGQMLLAAGKTQQATTVLLRGFRQFKKDLLLCETLAQAQSADQHKDYAYFTKAQCQLLQGLTRQAMQQLKQARRLAKHNVYLQSRIEASMEEIKLFTQYD